MLYFLTTKDFGSRMTLEPRIPLGAAIGEDRTIPRICVATTVEGCVSAINVKKLNHRNNFLYVVDNPKGEDWCGPERHVEDAVENGEVWLLEPNEFRKIGTVDFLSEPWEDTRIQINIEHKC